MRRLIPALTALTLAVTATAQTGSAQETMTFQTMDSMYSTDGLLRYWHPVGGTFHAMLYCVRQNRIEITLTLPEETATAWARDGFPTIWLDDYGTGSDQVYVKDVTPHIGDWEAVLEWMQPGPYTGDALDRDWLQRLADATEFKIEAAGITVDLSGALHDPDNRAAFAADCAGKRSDSTSAPVHTNAQHTAVRTDWPMRDRPNLEYSVIDTRLEPGITALFGCVSPETISITFWLPTQILGEWFSASQSDPPTFELWAGDYEWLLPVTSIEFDEMFGAAWIHTDWQGFGGPIFDYWIPFRTSGWLRQFGEAESIVISTSAFVIDFSDATDDPENRAAFVEACLAM